MMLSKENIVFIDHYLQNSKIIYFDLRTELIDHVATAVEQKMVAENLAFYDAFKSYMAKNKRTLLRQNKKEGFDFSLLPKFIKFLIQPIQILIFLITFGVCYMFFQNYSATSLFLNTTLTLFLLFIPFSLYQWIYLGLYKKKRFYYIEKLGGTLFIISQLVYFSESIFRNAIYKSNYFELFAITLYIGLFINYFIFHFTELYRFKKKNKVLFQ